MQRVVFFIVLIVNVLSSKGQYVIIEDSIVGSKIYPETVHCFKVAVPDGYDGSVPGALYLGLDGILCNAPEVIDSLTAVGDMPVTIGVYLQPGVVKDKNTGRVLRYNRSNEFDATDGRFAEFLVSELLPYIESMQTSDGRRIRISDRAEDRCIFGLSSGGIAAFVSAWHRPDVFGKVFSGCGTFVPMRGGNDLQAIVRKHEPKPLRIFLQDGYSDTWNPLFGSWYEANRQLASALEFADYDCSFDWAEGGHSVRRATEIFPQVMKWLWNRDSAPRVTGNDFLQPLLEGAGDWTSESATPEGTEFAGVKAVYPDGTLCAARMEGANWLTQSLIDGDGNEYGCQRFYWLHAYNNSLVEVSSMAFDNDGSLWVVTDAGIQVCDHNGRVRGILGLPAGFEGAAVALTDGKIYLKSPSGDILSRKINVSAPKAGHTPVSQGQG